MFLITLVAIATKVQGNSFDPGPAPMLMRHPTMNKTTIVFEFADDLWSVPGTGGAATRLTTAPGEESDPFFSPDGKWIAFTAEYDGNQDVYVMPAEGGIPKRLTAHPAPDKVVGWAPDGKSVLFTSSMLSNTDLPRLFTVSVTGGFPKPVPLPSGTMGSYSPDGKNLAYVPSMKWEEAWKRYRGGQTYPIWIADLSDSHVKEIPRDNTNDEQPVWFGNKIYFLTDKRGPVGLSSYDVSTGKVSEEIVGAGFDLKSVTAGPDALVYERLGSIHIFDTTTHKSQRVPIQIHGDFQEIRPQYKDLQKGINGITLSPSGARLGVATRGWVLTAPASKGDARVIDEAQGVHRRDPDWSPNGKTMAYITDQNGRQQLALNDLATGTIKTVDLGESPGYYYAPKWSPDSSKIAYTDNRHIVWILDVASGKNTQVDATIFNNPRFNLVVNWSPDSKWLTWARDLTNHLNAIFVYSLESGKKTQITDGLADAKNPVFDRDGKYLYFYASTNVGQAASWLDLSSFNNLNIVSSVYGIVLKKDGVNPLQPQSDEEVIKEPAKPAATPTPPAPAAAPFKIDLEEIESRIFTLPIPAQNFTELYAGTAGVLFTISSPKLASPTDLVPGSMIGKFSFADRQYSPFSSGVTAFFTSQDGTKAVIGKGPSISIVPTTAPPAPGQGSVNLATLHVKIDPAKEWKSMFQEIWRNEKLLIYSPTVNGISVETMERRYQPFLSNIYSRNDLNYLFTDMLGELCVGHEFPGGGDIPSASKSIPGGLLGADYTFDGGKYRLSKVYDGERWNPGLYAPLRQPGINAKAGEYILAIDGKELSEATDIYEALEGKAGKQVKIKLGPTSDGKNSREVTVVPTAREFGLRSRAWAEDNRRYVEKMTNGRAGYVHVPDTAEGGWTEFNRYYYAQIGKDGIVVDERFNHGGLINDFMIREMQKPIDAYFVPRHGQQWPTPGSAIYGPKVMLANQFSGSGGDMFPWLFKFEKVGKLIGKRTWGGLIAAFGFELVDGGHINSPDIAFYNPHNNTWDVENWGVAPDMEVELDPYLWRKGHDAQLDRAIEVINKELAGYKAPTVQHPPYPDRSKVGVRY